MHQNGSLTEFEKVVIRLFLNDPFTSSHFKSCKNPAYAIKIARNLIPYSTGIEFEIGYEMVHTLKRNKQRLISRKKASWDRLETNHSEDYEVSMRIDNMKDLKVLSEIYAYMNKSFNSDKRLNNSGIHIHTDLGKYFGPDSRVSYRTTNVVKEVKKIPKINEFVVLISRVYFQYGGHYNEDVFSDFKGNSLIYRSKFNTFEYRCINMTWNFRELLKHIILCHTATKMILEYIEYDKKGITPSIMIDDKILNFLVSLKKL